MANGRLNRRGFLKMLGVGAVSFGLPGCASGDSRGGGGKRPNFVFFLVDDMGWTDAVCYGSSFYETPNVDRLCASGMKFTQAYAACPVCSPTRASLMTGKSPAAVKITAHIPGSLGFKRTPKEAIAANGY